MLIIHPKIIIIFGCKIESNRRHFICVINFYSKSIKNHDIWTDNYFSMICLGVMIIEFVELYRLIFGVTIDASYNIRFITSNVHPHEKKDIFHE